MSNTTFNNSSRPIDVLRWVFHSSPDSAQVAPTPQLTPPSSCFAAFLKIQSDIGAGARETTRTPLSVLFTPRFDGRTPPHIRSVRAIVSLYHNAVRCVLNEPEREWLLTVGEKIRSWSSFELLETATRKDVKVSHRLGMDSWEWLLDQVSSLLHEVWVWITRARYSLDQIDREQLLEAWLQFEKSCISILSTDQQQIDDPARLRQRLDSYLFSKGDDFSSKAFVTIARGLVSESYPLLQALQSAVVDAKQSLEKLVPQSEDRAKVAQFKRLQAALLAKVGAFSTSIS